MRRLDLAPIARHSRRMHNLSALPTGSPVPDKASANRRRVDLRLARVMLALVVSPLLGTLVLGLAIAFMTSKPLDEPETFRRFVFWLLGPVLWSLICGVAYLQSVTRVRGQIARSECLFLGCMSAYLSPFALNMADSLILHGNFYFWHGDFLFWGRVANTASAALLTLPFGLFGGWVFWRLGVRPAEAPTRDLAPVFD
jgi:hypothetical protein